MKATALNELLNLKNSKKLQKKLQQKTKIIFSLIIIITTKFINIFESAFFFF
jgi:nitrogen fixation/metabolism regulation signal transduction histidine kinase